MSERSLFRPILSNKNNFPWYDRSLLENFTQFGFGQRDGFTAYVTSQALLDLHKGTAKVAPLEAFGLLLGRVYADNYGYFTVVARAYYADKADAAHDHIYLSHEEMSKFRTKASISSPAMDFVGWTHSHPFTSEYSTEDFREQHTWNEDYHVGILTFTDVIQEASDEAWAVAYRGPLAQLLPMVVNAAPTMRKDKALSPSLRRNIQRYKVQRKRPVSHSVPLASEQNSSESDVEKSRFSPGKIYSGSNTPRSIRGTVIRIIAALLIVILGSIAGNVIVNNWRSSPTLQSGTTSQPLTNLLWDCDQQKGQAPFKITCAGPVGPTIQQWHWDFGDSATSEKSIASHVYTKPGTYKITLVVVSTGSKNTSKVSTNAGSIIVQVTSP